MALEGKGFYIWQIRRCEAGDVHAIANIAVQAGLTHTLIKIADGDHAYNVDSTTGADLVLPLVTALRDRGLESWGWHYVYGYDPDAEAEIAIERILQTGVAGYIIDAEDQYKEPGRDAVARQFMARLRAVLPTFPIALSSYRYPTYHPTFPWQPFLEEVDINMPQVYWVGAHNPGDQLARCLREFQAITPFRPIIPTGAAYVQGSWQPTAGDIVQFMDAARNLGMPAANFWEWGHTRLYLPDLWNAIAAYAWPIGPSDADIVARYFAALNRRDISQIIALYDSRAVHVTAHQTLQGIDAIRQWYQSLLNEALPNAAFTLVEENGAPGSRQFSWTATSSAGEVPDGQDAFGLAAGKIVYHYSQFNIIR